jgi:hypothetical protein
MNRHNSKIIQLHFRDAPRCARGASLLLPLLPPSRAGTPMAKRTGLVLEKKKKKSIQRKDSEKTMV